MDVSDLRSAAKSLERKDQMMTPLQRKLYWAADEIERLREERHFAEKGWKDANEEIKRLRAELVKKQLDA
jgi:hypothetical protein